MNEGGRADGAVDNVEKKLAHLNLIETVISRMGSNSFLLKGWSVTLVAALFALAAKDTKPALVLVAYLPGLAFWALDGYYLWQETLFRRLYDKVRGLAEDQIDFSMSTAKLADLPNWLSQTFSNTLVLFHGTVVATIVVVTWVLYG
jgi:hypothetical protein